MNSALQPIVSKIDHQRDSIGRDKLLRLQEILQFQLRHQRLLKLKLLFKGRAATSCVLRTNLRPFSRTQKQEEEKARPNQLNSLRQLLASGFPSPSTPGKSYRLSFGNHPKLPPIKPSPRLKKALSLS
ncbi:hypothetical protein Salat_2969300 [Sesamum alatum]|uniref:Uncharacterized protein n=1 Tax=Sesamum alatum TaxID=300844 RepID=A0AAE1XIS5_9LAMI|nr:hypothetical protein Salat_2969300 [Sesamum alatum]